ncbi:DUF685 domain-containing protein (plasmid) [Borreliella americana]|uniref:DUF685 domain-containing protein n=1 Tax=Borreliella americana TaxID=478807 RepID=A0ACD5G676_9SPIR
MSAEEKEKEKLLIDEEETVQIKDLNRVNDVKNTDLLLLDDGVSSSNAITYENFLKTTKDKTFKGEGLSYFKDIIKSTIAEELAADTNFIEKIYTKITDKLINNDSTNISNLFSKIKSELTNSIETDRLTENDELLIMYSSKIIQKTPVPKQLLGVPSDFSFGGNYHGLWIYPEDYTNKKRKIEMEDCDTITIVFHKENDNKPIYLDIDLNIIHKNDSSHKLVYLKYSDESEEYLVYAHENAIKNLGILVPIYTGWYVQKRAMRSGIPVPYLAKL